MLDQVGEGLSGRWVAGAAEPRTQSVVSGERASQTAVAVVFMRRSCIEGSLQGSAAVSTSVPWS
jgi:hypothetical protein